MPCIKGVCARLCPGLHPGCLPRLIISLSDCLTVCSVCMCGFGRGMDGRSTQASPSLREKLSGYTMAHTSAGTREAAGKRTMDSKWTHLGMTGALGATGTGLKHGARFGERRASGLISSQRPLANLTLKLTPRGISSKRVQSWDRSCLDTLGAKGQRSTQLTASWNGPSESNSCREKAAGWPRPSLRKVRARQERQV